MKQFLKTMLTKLGYQVVGTRYIPRQLLDLAKLRALTFDDVVCRYMFDCSRELTFVQVGVFDGVTHDPWRKYIMHFWLARCPCRAAVVKCGKTIQPLFGH